MLTTLFFSAFFTPHIYFNLCFFTIFLIIFLKMFTTFFFYFFSPHIFICPKKPGRIMGTRAAGSVQSICPLNNLSIFHCIIIKLCENVCWQNISAKFDNQPDPIKHFGVHSVTWIVFNGSSSNFVTLFVGIISWPSSVISQIT